MKKIRGTLEPWNPLSLFNKGKQEPEADKKGVEKSKSADLGNILEKHKVVAKKILSKSPTNEGFYSVNPVTVQNDFQGVWTPLDFDIDALYAIPKKRNKCVRNETTVERSYANISESKYQPLAIKASGEELHYQVVVPRPLRCKRSKSAQNLHKTEIKVFLHRTPSCEVYDVPRQAKPVLQDVGAFSRLHRYAEVAKDDDVDSSDLVKVDAEVSPKADAEISAIADAEISAIVDVEISPKVDVETSPKVDVEISPKVDVETSSKVDVEISPKMDAEISPQVDVEDKAEVKETTPDFTTISLSTSQSSTTVHEPDSTTNYDYWEERKRIKEPHLLTRSKSLKLSKAWRGFKVFIEDEKKKLDKLVSGRSEIRRKKVQDVDAASSPGDVVADDCSLKPDLGKMQGQNGYEDLRRYIKSGEDLNKELATILQERADAEMTYAKQLCKLSSKLNRACRDSRGGVATALRGIASDMEGRGDVHRQFSSSLNEEIVRPLRQLSDSQHRTRKAAELVCDKSLRQLTEWRAAEAKAKKQSHQAARENEKLQDASLDARLARAPSIGLINHHPSSIKMHPHANQNQNQTNNQTDKDAARTEQKRKKAELAVKKADVEYYTLCVRAERARLDWESSVTRACRILETLERERIVKIKGAIGSYCELSEHCAPLMGPQRETQMALSRCDPDVELEHVQAIRRQTEGPCEQLLPDFYCEHTTLAMNRERRKQALVKLLQLVRQDLIREKKSKVGVENLYKAVKKTNGSIKDQTITTNAENPVQDESQQNIEEKLYHIRCMLLYLEGARYKLHAALCELDHRTKTDHPLAAYLRVTRDRTGLQQSVLRAPSSLRDAPPLENGDADDTAPHTQVSTHDDDDNWSGEGRGAGDGLSNQRDSDYDEFSSQGSFNDDSTDTLQIDADVKVKDDKDEKDNHDSACETDGTDKIIGYCKALYEYEPALDDELFLSPGDVIGVIKRQQDGWWVGLLKGKVGVFPATYVQDPADN